MENIIVKFKKWLIALVAFVILIVGAWIFWSHIINFMMPRDSRPGRISFAAETMTKQELEALSSTLPARFKHAKRFLDAGILSYEGPSTCLKCHEKIKVKDPLTGAVREVDTMKNVTTSVHYRFFSKAHPNVYGFNGKLADNFPMGKIDRPCPKPGSFAFTAWAETVDTPRGKKYSEGCGQCHIGGQYQAPLGELMPLYRTLDKEKEAIDCLICHSAGYDMNQKQVVTDGNGLKRWGQDRSMKAAVMVEKPTSQTCLRCHQHNFGGDIYIDEADPSFMDSMRNTGQERPRVLHPGSKRGTPYSPSWDVHAAAGLSCLDCHVSEGHYIARGTHTTTIMANDLPGVELACQACHSDKPHKADPLLADTFNTHAEKIACQTCHIPSLQEDNVTMRDFSTPVHEDGADLYIYSDIAKETAPGRGIKYAWWNGDATFLGNPIGDNPNGKDLYDFYTPEHVWPEFKTFDYKAWYEKVMRPLAKKGRPSKLHPFKLYNGKQHTDLANMGPFGGMFVPYNLPAYYTTGNPGLAGRRELEKPMMKMMYGWMFKVYLMDKFMSFMMVDGWNAGGYRDAAALKNVEARWIPKDPLLEIDHAIRRKGALTCNNCHGPEGALDWKALGYPEEQIKELIQNPI